MLAERTNAVTKLALESSVTAVTTTSRQDYSDQKAFIEQRYAGETSLRNFTDDLKVESLMMTG